LSMKVPSDRNVHQHLEQVPFSNAMPAFESYAIEDDRLRIRYADGELLFRRVSE
jgi:hypothetical protein